MSKAKTKDEDLTQEQLKRRLVNRKKNKDRKRRKIGLKDVMFEYLLNHESKDLSVSFNDFFKLCANNQYADIDVGRFQDYANEFMAKYPEYYSSVKQPPLRVVKSKKNIENHLER